jgi:hypothetical protein
MYNHQLHRYLIRSLRAITGNGRQCLKERALSEEATIGQETKRVQGHLGRAVIITAEITVIGQPCHYLGQQGAY